MSTVVHKYPLRAPGLIVSVRIPQGPFSVVLTDDLEDGRGPQIWLLHEADVPKERDVYFVVVATGQEFGSLVDRHVGSFVQRRASEVWHVFLLCGAPPSDGHPR